MTVEYDQYYASIHCLDDNTYYSMEVNSFSPKAAAESAAISYLAFKSKVKAKMAVDISYDRRAGYSTIATNHYRKEFVVKVAMKSVPKGITTSITTTEL